MMALHADTITRRREEKFKLRQAKAAETISQPANEEGLIPLVAPILNSKDSKTSRLNDAEQDVGHLIKIAGSSEELSWYHPESASFETLEEARLANLWHYPTTDLEIAKCAVFEDLWQKGYFMGAGLRFGGDFLVYPSLHFLLPFLVKKCSYI